MSDISSSSPERSIGDLTSAQETVLRALVELWLEGEGQNVIAHTSLTPKEAVESVLQLIKAGLLVIIEDGDGYYIRPAERTLQ